jgi:hypothetical protein
MIARPDTGDPLAPHSLSPSELKELMAAERTGEPFLVFRDDQARLALFPASRGSGTVTVGRRPETDVALAWDGEVSGLHAELHEAGGEWSVVDDGLSTNGTFLNGQRVAGRRRLRDGDRVRLGRTVLVFRSGGGPAVAPTAAAVDAPAPQQLTTTQRSVVIALCRPYGDGDPFASPATNQQIASELFLSVEAVKMHLRTLFGKFELAELPQNEKRARLAECVLEFGVVSRHELR